jgi:hypothetical protein
MENTELQTWLDSEISRNTQYHNHKEMMAWLPIALYVTGVLAGLKLDVEDSLRWWVTIPFAFISIGLLLFVVWQLRNRSIARIKVKYLIQTRLERLAENFPDNWEKCIDTKYWLLPNHIIKKMKPDEVKKIHGFSDTCIPEFLSYLVIIASAALFVFSVWEGFDC